MRLYFSLLKKRSFSTLIAGSIYLSILLVFIYVYNSNSSIDHLIDPYLFGSEPLDFFFAIIVSVPFSFYTFYLKKDHFLDYATLRFSGEKYLLIHLSSLVSLCFMMVFLVNIIGVVFSTQIATLSGARDTSSLAPYLFGKLQMSQPLLFGILWSFHKSFVAALICTFAQVIALYIDNLFLALFLPFIYVLVENFLTAMLGLERFSLTSTFVLNRLAPTTMLMKNIVLSLVVFIAIILATDYGLKIYAKN